MKTYDSKVKSSYYRSGQVLRGPQEVEAHEGCKVSSTHRPSLPPQEIGHSVAGRNVNLISQ